MGEIIKRVKIKSDDPFFEFEEITIKNNSKNPEIWRNYLDERIIILAGESKSFVRGVQKQLGKKPIRVVKRPLYDIINE